MRPGLVAVAMLTLASPAGGAPTGGTRPEFPPVGEARQIDHKQVPVHYPRFVLTGQVAVFANDPQRLETSFEEVLANYEVLGASDLPWTSLSVGFQLRLQLSYRVGLGVESMLLSWFGDEIEVEYQGVLGFVVLTSPRLRAISLAAGAGVGRERLSAQEDFSIGLDGGDTLEGIAYDSNWQTVIPLAVVLEVPNHRYTRYAFVLSCRRLFGDVDNGFIDVYYAASNRVPVEATIDGWCFTAGVAVAF